MVDSVLSYGAEVWGLQLAAQAAASPHGNSNNAAEKLQLSFLRRLLGVRQGTPNAVLLAEAGHSPLWLSWLRRAARLWNKILAEQPGSLLRQTLAASIQLAAVTQQSARQSWAAQLAAGMAAIGMPLDLQHPAPIPLKQLTSCGRQRQLQQFQSLATRVGASKMQHYMLVCGGNLEASSFGQREAYLVEVRQRHEREALAQLRTGSHWGAEETGRWQGHKREERICPHCHGGIEDVSHIIFDCPLYAPVRHRWPDLFQIPHSLHLFLQQPAQRVASFATACRKKWQTATAALDE